MAPQKLLPYLNTREDSAIRFLGGPVLMRSTGETTNGAFGLLEQWMMPPGFGSPYHTHHREDEAFYVLDGDIAFVCDGKWMQAGPGTYVFGPREIPHGFQVVGNGPARMLLLCVPSGFELFVQELSEPLTAPPSKPDMAALVQVAAKYGIEIHGPLPELPEGLVGKPVNDNRSLTLRWLQAFNERDWKAEAASRSQDFQALLPGMPGPLDGDAWAGFLQGFVTAFPDAKLSVDLCIADGDTVASRWTITGTHRGVFQGMPPTGRAVTMTGMECNRMVNGKIAEHRAQFDMMGLLQQIGAMPA